MSMSFSHASYVIKSALLRSDLTFNSPSVAVVQLSRAVTDRSAERDSRYQHPFVYLGLLGEWVADVRSLDE